MKIIFLDRNILITIKEKLNGQKILPFRDQELRKLDNEKNHISSLFAIIEGQSGQKENLEEIKKTIDSDIKLMTEFFKRAKIDSEFILSTKNEFAELFSKNSVEISWDAYKKFLLETNDILYQPVSRINRKKYQNTILEIATKYDIEIVHPIVICCLSILHGNDNSRKILKFKQSMTHDEQEKNIYNALNDILIVSRLMQIQALKKQYSKSFNLVYFTFDNPLKEFLRCIKANAKTIIDESAEITATEIEVVYPKELFPNLDKEESYQQFICELKDYKTNKNTNF